MELAKSALHIPEFNQMERLVEWKKELANLTKELEKMDFATAVEKAKKLHLIKDHASLCVIQRNGSRKMDFAELQKVKVQEEIDSHSVTEM